MQACLRTQPPHLPPHPPFALSPALPFFKAGRDHARYRVKTDTGRSYFHSFTSSTSSWPLETFAARTGAEAPRPTTSELRNRWKRSSGNAPREDLEAIQYALRKGVAERSSLGAFQRGRSERQAKVSQALTFFIS